MQISKLKKYKEQNKESGSSSIDEEVDMSDALSLIWEEKWVISAFLAAFLILGIFFIRVSPSYYSSFGRIILDNQDKDLIEFENPISGISSDKTELNSQIEIIKSRNVIEQVVSKNKLHEDPEFVLSLREKNNLEKIFESAKSTASTYLFPHKENKQNSVERTPENEAIDELTDRLVVKIIPNTYVFEVSIETFDPKKSALIVNSVAESYIEREISLKIERTNYAALWLADKIDILRKTVEETESVVAEYQKNMERGVSDEDILVFNRNLQNARGRLSSLTDQIDVNSPINDLDRIKLEDAKRTVSELEEIVGRQFDSALKLKQLQREAESASVVYEYFLKRFNEIEIQKGVQQASVSILSDAIPVDSPVKPKPLLILLISSIAGILLAGIFIAARRAYDNTFKDPVELKDHFDIPVLGFVPIAPVKQRRRLLDYAVKHPSSQFVESFRTLRTSLTANDLLLDNTVLMTTSSVPGEGKTTSAVLLSIVTAALDKRVLLIECDLRRMALESYFPRDTEYGLISALSDEAYHSSAINFTNFKKLHVIYGEKSELIPSDVFSSDKFSDFLSKMRKIYDLIILDTPPVIPVPDARIIARHADCILYSVRAGKTPSSIVQAGIDLFQDFDVEISGLILTQVKKDMKYAGYKYGYGYGNQYYQGSN